MRELPTLGGYHGFATGVNNRGLVVGWAETPVHAGQITGRVFETSTGKTLTFVATPVTETP